MLYKRTKSSGKGRTDLPMKGPGQHGLGSGISGGGTGEEVHKGAEVVLSDLETQRGRRDLLPPGSASAGFAVGVDAYTKTRERELRAAIMKTPPPGRKSRGGNQLSRVELSNAPAGCYAYTTPHARSWPRS